MLCFEELTYERDMDSHEWEPAGSCVSSVGGHIPHSLALLQDMVRLQCVICMCLSQTELVYNVLSSVFDLFC